MVSQETVDMCNALRRREVVAEEWFTFDRSRKNGSQVVVTQHMRLLDLCGCEGGATAGYQLADWHVTAVDEDAAALARNPADVTVKADALTFLADHWREFDAYHLSAPCQRWCANGANPAANDYPDLITPGRELLEATGRPWVMENVPKAPLRRDLILCGTMFGLTTTDADGTLLHLDRHRVFESNVPLHLPAGARPVSPHRCGPRPGVQWAGVYGGARKDKTEARTVRKGGYVPAEAAIQSALLGGVDWMTGKGRRECIPPIYAEWVGAQLMAATETGAPASAARLRIQRSIDEGEAEIAATCPTSLHITTEAGTDVA